MRKVEAVVGLKCTGNVTKSFRDISASQACCFGSNTALLIITKQQVHDGISPGAFVKRTNCLYAGAAGEH